MTPIAQGGSGEPPLVIIARHHSRRNWLNGAWTRANSWLPTGTSARLKKRGYWAWKFSARKIHPQRHRGCFGEFVRRDEGILARIGLWPKQWSAARMFASTAKGFHVHPPSVPGGSAAADWLRRLFVDEPENYSLRRYDEEQWDVMFFLQGRVETILCDIRAGLPRRVMRFFIDGDNHRGNNNVGVVIPPGVAHAHSR